MAIERNKQYKGENNPRAKTWKITYQDGKVEIVKALQPWRIEKGYNKSGLRKLQRGFLIRAERTRPLDEDFLEFLDGARKNLASCLLKNNKNVFIEGVSLNEATQKILDRVLFLRICEDRDIDTGIKLASLVDLEKSQDNEQTDLGDSLRLTALNCQSSRPYSLYKRLAEHFKTLDKRAPSTSPFFNGQLFKSHFSEELAVDDGFLEKFIACLSNENSPYLFNMT